MTAFREDRGAFKVFRGIPVHNVGEDIIELNPEELENLKATEAELEEFGRKMVCFVERNEETGAVEIMPGNGGKIILNDTGQIKAFLQIVGSYLKGGTEDGRG